MGAQTRRDVMRDTARDALRESGDERPQHVEPDNAATGQDADNVSGFVVARGRSVRIDGKLRGPGQPVDLPEQELAHLRAAGFLVPVRTEAVPGAGVKVGTLQIRGGRKPGAAIA